MRKNKCLSRCLGTLAVSVYLLALPACGAGSDAQDSFQRGAVGQEVQQLVDMISPEDKSQNQKAMTGLVSLDDRHTKDLVNALLNVHRQLKNLEAEMARPGLAEARAMTLAQEVQKAGWQRIQLITLLGHRSGPGVIDALMLVAQETPAQSAEQMSIMTSLASQGPSPRSREYFLALLNNPESGFYQKKGAIGYLSLNSEPSDSAVVDKLLRETSDPKLMGLVIYWASELKDRNEMLRLIEQFLARKDLDRDAHYLPLFALAKIATPAELEAAVAGKPINSWDKASALHIAEFRLATPDEKEKLIPRLLASRYTEEKEAALKYMLSNNRTDLMQRHVVGSVRPDPTLAEGGTIFLSPTYQRLIRLTGYEVRVEAGQLVIERLGAR